MSNSESVSKKINLNYDLEEAEDTSKTDSKEDTTSLKGEATSSDMSKGEAASSDGSKVETTSSDGSKVEITSSDGSKGEAISNEGSKEDSHSKAEKSKDNSKLKGCHTPSKTKVKTVESRYMTNTRKGCHTPSKTKMKTMESRYMTNTSKPKRVLNSTKAPNSSCNATLPSFGDISTIKDLATPALKPKTTTSANKKPKTTTSAAGRPKTIAETKAKKMVVTEERRKEMDTREARAARQELYNYEYAWYVQRLYLASKMEEENQKQKEALEKTMDELDYAIEQDEQRLLLLEQRCIILEEVNKVLEFKKFFSTYLDQAMEELEKIKEKTKQLCGAVSESQDALRLKGVKSVSTETLQAAIDDFELKTKEARELVKQKLGVVQDAAETRTALYLAYSRVKTSIERARIYANETESLIIQKQAVEAFKAA